MEGFKAIQWSGIFDMPSRKGETSYDWGDEIQPLTDDEDLVWNSRQFKLKALFDKRINGNDFTAKKAEIKALKKFPLSTPIGILDVWIEGFGILHENSVVVICEFDFYEQKPSFDFALPPKSRRGSTIDGFGFYADLGVSFVLTENEELAELKDLSKTVYQKGNEKSEYRELPEISLKCYSEDVKAMQKILSANGLREIKHNGRTYKGFFTKGFKVSQKGSGFSYEIKLTVNEII